MDRSRSRKRSRDEETMTDTVAHLYGREGPVGVRCASSVLAKSNTCFLVEDVVVDVAEVPHGQVRCKNTVKHGIKE
jgi:hypothetical protein